MRIRPRDDGDLDACVALAEAVHARDGYPPRLPGEWSRFIDAPDAITAWVAVVNGTVVGHVALHASSSPEVMALASRVAGVPESGLGVVARLLVDPDHRRSGIGRSLLDAAADAAHVRGRRPVLDVATRFEGAINLYEEAGWRRAGQVTVRIRGTEPLDEVVFVAPKPDVS